MNNRRIMIGCAWGLFICLGWTAMPLANAPYRHALPGPDSPRFAPDRILVQFKENSLQKIKGKIAPLANSANVAIGVSSVDAITKQLGVTAIGRTFVDPADASKARDLGVDRWYTMHIPVGTDISDAVSRYAADPNVDHAEPDWYAFPQVVPDDPGYSQNWGHHNTGQLPGVDWGGTYSHTLSTTVGAIGFDANAERGWDGPAGFGSSTVIIAIVDSGCNLSHPDLAFVTGYDFGDNDSNPEDDCNNPNVCGHGTCCAGVAAARGNNGQGACGAAPNALIMPLKAADVNGNMAFSSIANCIYYAADNGADIISMSLGAHGITGVSTINTAIGYAFSAGLLLFAATDNYNSNMISYPAINVDVIAVGAASPCGDRKRSSGDPSELNPFVSPDYYGCTCDGERWWGSSYGVAAQDGPNAVDILGPTILYTTDPVGARGFSPGDYEPFFNGTSCATPYVAGVAALIKAANPSFTAAQIRTRLLSTAIDVVNVESWVGWDIYSGYGMVNMEGAVGNPCVDGGLTINTGWDPSPGSLPTGDPDPDWIVVSDPYPNTTEPRVATTVDSDPSWLTLPASKWINTMENYFGPVNGHFVFEYRFCLEDNAAFLNMSLRADDEATVSVNGHAFDSTVAQAYNQPPLVIATTTSDFQWFHAGENVLTVNVNNTGAGSVGFDATGQITGLALGHSCCTTNSCSISGAVFYDKNLNHKRDPWENAVTLCPVVLYRDREPQQVAIHATDGFGDYCFTDLDQGVYRVEPQIPGPYTTTTSQSFIARCADRGHDVSHLDFGYRYDPTKKPRILPKPYTVPTPDGATARIDHVTLLQNVPNPFNPQTEIKFAVPRDMRITLAVYDVEGRLVRMLADETQHGGVWLSVTWDGKSDRGNPVASGVYFYRLTSPGGTLTRKMLLLK